MCNSSVNDLPVGGTGFEVACHGGQVMSFDLCIAASSISTSDPIPSLTSHAAENHTRYFFVQGFTEQEPTANLEDKYFPIAASKYEQVKVRGGASSSRTISVVIPCYNEEDIALQRTLKSFQEQSLIMPGFRFEIIVVMDGVTKMSESMSVYLQKLFGVRLNSEDRALDPFIQFPETVNTVIVEPISQSMTSLDVTNSNQEETFNFGLSLVVKRVNKRKVNSQLWCLASHAIAVQCEYAFLTDCGIVFDKNCLSLLAKRMVSEENLLGVSGFQRGMSAVMQGEGTMEWLKNPVNFILRQLQNYDHEFAYSNFKSFYDLMGYMTVLPGPCGLFRYKHLGTMDEEESPLKKYFELTTRNLGSNGIVLGNVQLAEDRFPSNLLTFMSRERCVKKGIRNPRTGFVRDAIYYFEAELPLSNLIKQRRRWTNGTFFAGYWLLSEVWMWRSDHSILVKVSAAVLVFLETSATIAVAIFGPSTFIAMWYAVSKLFASVISKGTANTSDDILSSTDPRLVSYGAIFCLLYLLLYVSFVVRHTPRAVPVKQTTESDPEMPTSGTTARHWRCDHRSAFRPRLFAIVCVANAVSSFLFLVGFGVALYNMILGDGVPMHVLFFLFLLTTPLLGCLADGLINSSNPNLKSFSIMLRTAPFTILCFPAYVFFLSYSIARISDLTWGNREIDDELEESSVAKHRSALGKKVSFAIIAVNILIAGVFISLFHTVPGFIGLVFFSMMVLPFTVVLINMTSTLWRGLIKLMRIAIP